MQTSVQMSVKIGQIHTICTDICTDIRIRTICTDVRNSEKKTECEKRNRTDCRREHYYLPFNLISNLDTGRFYRHILHRRFLIFGISAKINSIRQHSYYRHTMITLYKIIFKTKVYFIDFKVTHKREMKGY